MTSLELEHAFYGNGWFFAFAVVAVALSLNGCATYEKSVSFSYERVGSSFGGEKGEVYLSRPVFDHPLRRLPGGKVLLGTVADAGIPIVTTDDAGRWIQGALIDDLFGAGYQVRTVASPSLQAKQGLGIRVEKFSSNQQSDGLILMTETNISLRVDIRKDGRQVKTLTAGVTRQDQGFDRSGDAVGSSFYSTLRSVLDELVPDIIKTLSH